LPWTSEISAMRSGELPTAEILAAAPSPGVAADLPGWS
jgi:hypothetical protein